MKLQTERQELIQEVASSSSFEEIKQHEHRGRAKTMDKKTTKKKASSRSKSNSHKFSNINARAFNCVVSDSKTLAIINNRSEINGRGEGRKKPQRKSSEY